MFSSRWRSFFSFGAAPRHQQGCLNRGGDITALKWEGDSGKCHRWHWVCHKRCPFPPVPRPRCSPLRSQSPVKRVEPAHPYACCYTWNGMNLLVVLRGRSTRQADRMSLASRPVRHHSICWPGERGHQDPQGRLVHCSVSGGTIACRWQSRK